MCLLLRVILRSGAVALSAGEPNQPTPSASRQVIALHQRGPWQSQAVCFIYSHVLHRTWSTWMAAAVGSRRY